MTRRQLQAMGAMRGHAGQPRWQEMAAGIALSLLFHGTILFVALFGVWCAGGIEEEEGEEYDLVFDDVELLALGEERDPHALPRLTGDEGSPPDPDSMAEITEDDPEVAVEPEVEPEVEDLPDPEEVERQRREEEEARRERERRRAEQERQRRMQEALGRFESDGRGDEAPEGSPHGIAGGTATDADQANMLQTYHMRLLRAIERHWEIPSTISDTELQQLAGLVRVHVRITDAGHISEFQFQQKSDHEQFDESIERVLRQFQAQHGGSQLPMPEEEVIRQQITSRGLTLTNWERVQRR